MSARENEIRIPYGDPRWITLERALGVALLWNAAWESLGGGRSLRVCLFLAALSTLIVRWTLAQTRSPGVERPGRIGRPAVAVAVVAMTVHIALRDRVVPLRASTDLFELLVLAAWQGLVVLVVLPYRARPSVDSGDRALRALALWTAFPAACANLARGIHAGALLAVIPLAVAGVAQARLVLRRRWLARVAAGSELPWCLVHGPSTDDVTLARSLPPAGPFRGADALVFVALVSLSRPPARG